MCGAPVPPATVPTHDDALPEPIAAYKAALLSLSSSLSQQLLVREAERGLLPLPAAALAAQRQMPPRDRQALASAMAAFWRGGGAPVPPPPTPNTRSVVATGVLSAPCTPSYYRSRSSPSSPPTTTPSPSPSPRGPPLTPSSSLYTAAAAAWSSNPPPPFPTAPAPPSPPAAPRVGRVEVRQVWARNFDDEARLVESLLPTFPYAAVDTAFPGTLCHHHPATAHTLTPEERYNLLRSTVDALDPTQLGLTLFDFSNADDAADTTECRLPALLAAGAGATTRHVVWQFNFFRDEPDSDDDAGVGGGVDAAAAFGPRLREWVVRLGLGRGGLVTSRGGYDVACLVKLMHGPGVFRIPASAAELEAVVAGVLIHRHRWNAAAAGTLGRVFDVREMARRCPMSRDELRRGMDGVAKELNAAVVGEGGARHGGAGYGSLVTCYMFGKLREICFDDDGKLDRVDGVLAEITAF